jgi:hypothetical protein
VAAAAGRQRETVRSGSDSHAVAVRRGRDGLDRQDRKNAFPVPPILPILPSLLLPTYFPSTLNASNTLPGMKPSDP